MRLGVVILPERVWPHDRRWQLAEELGFDSAWTYDHLWWRAMSDEPWFGTVPVLTAAALSTGRIQLGTLVATPNFRHPCVLAKDAMTLDHMSNGRFLLGLGAGSAGTGDATVLDRVPLAADERADRFEEFVTLTDRLLRTPVTRFEGRHYWAHEARMLPGCLQKPRLPLVIAGPGPRGASLAARFGQAWVTLGPAYRDGVPDPERCFRAVRRQLARLRAACEAADRAVTDLDTIFVVTDPAALASPAACLDHAARYAAAGITHIVFHWPRASGVYSGDEEGFAGLVSDVRAELADL
ncbi:LLM class flavin-dependent oxidoreductase [Streptomyces sp. NPDC050619]|uniref:LLM class flavin-dependent oxidoreductase n=1 Tax=Streptomyces sp. NPDC050619 TaxID=3157214 RepID=UPI0034159A8D